MGSSSSRLRVIKVESDGSRPRRPRAGDLMPRGSALYIMSKKYGEIAIKCDEWMNMTRACGRPFLALVVLTKISS